MIYLCDKVYLCFAIYCTHMTPDAPWHHPLWWTNAPHHLPACEIYRPPCISIITNSNNNTTSECANMYSFSRRFVRYSYWSMQVCKKSIMFLCRHSRTVVLHMWSLVVPSIFLYVLKSTGISGQNWNYFFHQNFPFWKLRTLFWDQKTECKIWGWPERNLFCLSVVRLPGYISMQI